VFVYQFTFPISLKSRLKKINPCFAIVDEMMRLTVGNAKTQEKESMPKSKVVNFYTIRSATD
jgi:hypothetical protein